MKKRTKKFGAAAIGLKTLVIMTKILMTIVKIMKTPVRHW